MFMHTPCLHFVVALLLVLLVGNQVSLGAMPGAAQLCMAGLKQLTVGQTTSRPVVKNRRILWYFGMGTTPSLPTVAVMVADLRTGDPPKATEIVRDAEVLFTGPPDLDEHGNVTYVKRVAGRHQVFLYDGISHLQLTENPALSGSPTIGLGTDKVSPGWPRVASKHVVFRDSAGNVFLYDSNRGMVQKINASDGQTANTGDGRVRSPIFAEVREFEFDGRYIVWLHEDRITPGAESRMTIYRAEPPYEELHKVVEFPAVMGSGAPVSTGSIFYPYFVACADKIAWQYFPRLVPNEATIGYHDGVSARILRTDAPARTQSTRIHNGQVTWLEFAPRPVDAQKVFLFDGTRISEVASFPDPPGNAAVGSRIWTDIHDVDIALGEVVYLAGEVECMGLFPGLCTPQGTNRFGIFKGSAGNTPVAVFETATGGAGVADFDSGLYVFQATCQPGSRDLAYFTVFEPSTASNVSLLLTDTTPQPSVLVTAEEKTVVVDGFKLSVAAKDCGASVNEGAAVTAMTFRGKASSGIDAKLSDIETVELYSDTDANQVIGPDDTLLGQGAFVGSTIRFAFTSPVTVHPGAERHFLLTYELAASVCPCNKYEALLMAGEIEATTTGLQAEPSKVGMSSGRVILPRPEFAMFSSTGMFGGDEQAGFTFGTLPKKLGIRVKDFPVRCGQAKFEISDKTAIGISDARLKIPGRESSRLILPFTQVNEDAVAEVEMRLGEEHGLYLVESTIEFTQPAMCEPPRHLFREHAGVIVLELVDANDPRFYEGTLVPGSPPKWEVKLTPDLDRLSTGGDPRLGTTTDGTSMLLVRLMLLGFMEPPPGQVRISLPAGGLGSLTTGLGSVIPPSSGGISVSVGWKKTSVGIYAFALYTPTLNFGDREITERVITLTAAYSLPGSAGSEEVKTEVVLYRPPVLFVHGMWADKTTWGNAFTSEDPRFEKYFADYSGGEPSGNAISFSENGQVIREAVYHIIQDRRTRRTATTQVIVVAHSMGGLLTRQFIADQDGQSYRRQDNFGQGDIYKFITIGTPHWGSPIAWLTVALRDHPNALVQQPFLEMVNGLGIDILSGAVDSLCPGSKELRSLGGTDVPTHTIMPWYLDTSNTAIGFWDFLKDLVLKIKGLKAGKLARASVAYKMLNVVGFVAWTAAEYIGNLEVAGLYSFDKTDLLVTNLSQSGGFVTGEGTSVIDNTTHMALGANLSPAVENETESEIVARVVEQLIYYPLNVDSRFKSALPSPSVQDNSVACNGSGLSLPRSLLAPEQQPAGRINILYPLDGQKASPGEKVMVTVQPPANARLTTVLFLSQAGADIVERSPFQAEMEIPVDFVGGFPLLVAARDNTGRLHISRPVNLDVTHSATLISLSVGLARLSMRLGASFRLSVNGVYSDGVSRNLTPANTGTFYQSGNEQIIAVDRNGLVTARAEGETIILISNGQVDQVIKVKVGQ